MENRVRMNTFVLLALVAFAQGNPSDPIAANSTVANSVSGISPTVITPAANSPSETTPKVLTQIDANATAIAELPVTGNTIQLTEIKVFYESMCSDCVNFFKNQLTPVYDKLNKFFNVTFSPFALGTINETTWITHCDRDGECEADKIHACGIGKIQNKDKLIQFVTCALVEGFKNKTLNQVTVEMCGKNNSIDNEIITSIMKCVNSSEWNSLLSNYSKRAREVQVKSVPTILINGIYDEGKQKKASENFQEVLCDTISEKDKPAECKKNSSGSDKVAIGLLPILVSIYFFVVMF